MDQAETALLVPVPAAEPVVARWRNRLDPAAQLGVPAHVTILYPFLPASLITEAIVADLSELFSPWPSFEFALRRVAWFNERVVYLAPDPDEPFRQLTHCIVERYPQYQPYGGLHPDLIPHLTIGDGAPVETLREAAEAVAISIAASASEVWLMAGSAVPRSWSVRAVFALAAGR